MKTKKKKVALNIATLIVCTAVAVSSFAYIMVSILSYFIVIPETGAIKELIAFMKNETVVECILLIIACCIFAFCIWLAAKLIQNLFGEAKRQIRRRRV